jgi:hypothetical protein
MIFALASIPGLFCLSEGIIRKAFIGAPYHSFEKKYICFMALSRRKMSQSA